SGDILRYARAMEASGKVLAATLLPSFPHGDTPYTGVSAIVVAEGRHGGATAAREVCDRMLAIAWERRAEYAFSAPPLAESVATARRLGAAAARGARIVISHVQHC